MPRQTPEELAKAKKEETKQEAAKLVGKLKSGNQDTTNKIISDTEQAPDYDGANLAFLDQE